MESKGATLKHTQRKSPMLTKRSFGLPKNVDTPAENGQPSVLEQNLYSCSTAMERCRVERAGTNWR